MTKQTSPEELITGVLAGDRLALARAISRVEDGDEAARPLIRALYPHTGSAHLAGITGAPGTGKSTLVAELAKGYRARGHTVAVLAVDPTSPFTGGALLGDRVRMERLSGDPGIFIRSMATRGHLGGLAAATADVLLVLEAAGFKRILVETVGAGQAEVAIAETAYTTVVVEAPGRGDEVQAIKAGILEIADLFVVNKADHPGVERTVAALEMMLQQRRGLSAPRRHHGRLLAIEAPASQSSPGGWQVQIFPSVATTGDGVAAVLDEIEAHRAWLVQSGEMAVRAQRRSARMVETLVQVELARRLQRAIPTQVLTDLVEAVSRREIDPHRAALQVVALLDRRDGEVSS